MILNPQHINPTIISILTSDWGGHGGGVKTWGGRGGNRRAEGMEGMAGMEGMEGMVRMVRMQGR
jgi:hypothetical protein